MAIKNTHEIRDPIHNFIRLDSQERKILNSAPFQRLRDIHQLGLTYLIYPGATHRRFEHSLGVMELATKIYDVVINHPFDDSVKRIVPVGFYIEYWKRVLRMAALCHDLGHLPFSHAAEKELLPTDWSHERLTIELILNSEIADTCKEIKISPKDVAKVAVGPEKYYKEEKFTPWECILSEIITGNVFGADRMDYLLRDSHHAGVAYGRFDHHRLIDTIRILPKVYEDSEEPLLGVEGGGLRSAESLLLARFYMFSQLYFHAVRVIYDIHLKDFLKQFLPEGYFSTDINDHLSTTDAEIIVKIRETAKNNALRGHDSAERIINRKHFKVLYEENPDDQDKTTDPGAKIYKSACSKFGEENLRHAQLTQSGGIINFPVVQKDDRIMQSTSASSTLKNLPIASYDYIFIEPELAEKGKDWLASNRENILSAQTEEEEG